MGTDRTDRVALLYMALRSLDITRLFSAWVKIQPEGHAAYTLTTELCGSTAQFASPDLTLHIKVHLTPRTGDEFANVLAGSRDKVRLSSLIAGHQQHLTLRAQGDDPDLRLEALRNLSLILCDIAPPEAIHWEPASRLLPTADFRSLAASKGRAQWRTRAVAGARGLKLMGAQQLLGHDVQLIGDALTPEDAEAFVFETVDDLLAGKTPELGVRTRRMSRSGQPFEVRLDYASDRTLCIRTDETTPSCATQKPPARVPKLALVLSKAKPAEPVLARSRIDGSKPQSGRIRSAQADPAAPQGEDALRKVFRPPTRLQRWLGV